MSTPRSPRRHDVDNLRSLAVMLLVPYHTARLFDGTPWHMKDANAPHPEASALLRMIDLWQMPLLFLLAGMAAAYALERRGALAFLRERASRLLLPLAFGILVLIPPQVWVERVTSGAPLRQSTPVFEGGFVAFLPEAFVCCYPEANFSWHHLWFLPYLFVYAVLLTLVSRAGHGERLANWVAVAPWRLLLPIVPLAVFEIGLRPTFPGSHDLVADWANHAHYGFLVVLGWWFARNPQIERSLSRRVAVLTGLAALSGALWFAGLPSERGGLGILELPSPTRIGIRIVAEWLVLLAMLAAAQRWLARQIRPLAAFAPLSFSFYMLHQTVIVLLGWALFGSSIEPFSKAIVIAAVSFAASVAGAAFIARSAWLGVLFGTGVAPRLAMRPSAVAAIARNPAMPRAVARQLDPALAASISSEKRLGTEWQSRDQ